MAGLRVFPNSVPQADLDVVANLDQQIERLRLQRNRQCQQITDRLLAGAAIDNGPHTAELVKSGRGATSVFYLVINGRKIR